MSNYQEVFFGTESTLKATTHSRLETLTQYINFLPPDINVEYYTVSSQLVRLKTSTYWKIDGSTMFDISPLNFAKKECITNGKIHSISDNPNKCRTRKVQG